MSGGKVAKNTAYLVTAFVGQKMLAFAYFTIVARMVGVQGSGRYFLATSFTTIFSIFIDVGLSNVLVRESAKDRGRAETLLANILGLKAILAVITVIAALITARLLDYPAETQAMIAVACAVMVLDSIHLVFYGVMRGFQDLRQEAIGVIAGQFVTIVAGMVFLALKLPLPFLIVALLLGSTWNVIWSSRSLIRKYGVMVRPRLDKSVVLFLWQVSLPFALSGIFARVYSYIDSIMLSKLADESAVGLYGVAYKVTFAFQFLPMAFAAAIYPAMSRYYATDKSKLGDLYRRALTYLFLAVAPLAVGIFALARPIISVAYGRSFTGAAASLQILIFSLVFAFLYWPAGSMLNACDRQTKNTIAMGCTMVVNIIMNAILIPRYGGAGAAAAALVGNAVLFGAAFYFARGIAPMDYRVLFSSAGRVIISVAAMYLVVHVLKFAAPVVVTILFGAATYVAAAFLTRAITASELLVLVSMFRKPKGPVAEGPREDYEGGKV